MADRTHSHDTSTPTMSAESVPSEDLARRAVAQLEFHGANSGVGYSPGILFRYGRSSSLFVSELDASTLSASHLAKEGGEAWAVEAAYREGHGDALLSSMDVDTAWDASTAKADLASHSQPSPALAKGGDAVREIAADLERSAGKPLVGGSWGGLALEPVARAITQDRGALSTPTEGPASQTEGMGGDAGAIRSAAFRLTPDEQHGLATALAANLGYDLTPEPPHPDAPGPGRFEAAAEKAFAASGEDTAVVVPEALAALTPPETAEAVPVGASARCSYCDGTGDVHRADGEWMGECDCSEGRATRLQKELERVTRELEEETALRVGAIDRMKDAERERDDAAKALEGVTEELGLFRDFVINNATAWTPGSNHHHPIWARVADRLGGYTSPRDGEKWPLVRAATASDPAPATDDRERLVEALRPFANAVFNDNGHMTVSPVTDYDAYVNAYFARRAALATEASR